MCNLYHMASRDDIEVYFRTVVWPNFVPKAVGPFNTGAFLRTAGGTLALVAGQWGLIAPNSKARRPASRVILTNNARVESVHERATYRRAWRQGQRCLIPAAWYQEPNWESGKNIWWQLRRADGAPWALAGIWEEWTDPDTGEIVPSYTMLTSNCDGHSMLSRLHKPDPKLPTDQQDKRAVLHIEPEHWDAWLHGDEHAARSTLRLPDAEFFDQSCVHHTDQVLAEKTHGSS